MDTADRAAVAAWLGHRPRDRRGLPVPYINRWGPETAESTHVRFDPRVGRDALFADDVGDAPDFTRQNFQRQRECMIDGVCQVCARPVPWSRRFIVVAPETVDFIRVPGHTRPVAVVAEPWLDERCAQIAVRWCPALIRRRRGDALRVHPVRSRRDVQTVVSVGQLDPSVGGPLPAPVVMWAKVALLTLDIRPQDVPPAPLETNQEVRQ